MSVFGTERGPANKAFEHDSSHRPPIAEIGVALIQEDLWCDIVRRTDGRIGHVPPRFPPRVDEPTIADGEVDLLVQGHRVTIPRLITLVRLHECLIV